MPCLLTQSLQLKSPSCSKGICNCICGWNTLASRRSTPTSLFGLRRGLGEVGMGRGEESPLWGGTFCCPSAEVVRAGAAGWAWGSASRAGATCWGEGRIGASSPAEISWGKCGCVRTCYNLPPGLNICTPRLWPPQKQTVGDGWGPCQLCRHLLGVLLREKKQNRR